MTVFFFFTVSHKGSISINLPGLSVLLGRMAAAPLAVIVYEMGKSCARCPCLKIIPEISEISSMQTV